MYLGVILEMIGMLELFLYITKWFEWLWWCECPFEGKLWYNG